ncbi:hypothetical protein LF1_53800 [Rubripirellula obstinata]|uniref:Uncharacterized protein n=1 Tax=Rubripirellula obstinata TaxID=406547 RepID=A0A5B1CAN7_9BACT|nr:hypothetical protein [Rubripirellula obstinata]KAA1257231.1 hypothetical protein LF1_53800 [Rubripirellula obstinata]
MVIRDHVYVGDRHPRGGQSGRQCSEVIAVTSNLPTMMARKGQNQSSSANLTLPQRVESGKNVPMRSPVTSGVGYEVAVGITSSPVVQARSKAWYRQHGQELFESLSTLDQVSVVVSDCRACELESKSAA